LTARDHHIFGLLAEHRVLTSTQLGRLCFPSMNRTRARLGELTERGMLVRFRRWREHGTYPWCYTFGHLGAAVHAAATDTDLPTPAQIARRLPLLVHSPTLDHLLGVAEFFTTLHAAGHQPTARAPGGGPATGRARAGGGELTQWWSEARTAAACGNLVRPDGFGEWTTTTPAGLSVSVKFFYEHDTGTETLDRLVDKLDRYEQLAATDINRPILFGLGSRAREEHTHDAITRRYGPHGPPGLTVATTHTAPPAGAADPSGAIWWPVGAPRRRRLAALHAPIPLDPWDTR
jgi:hypothetical protein